MKKTKTGIVISDKMKKTRVVLVERKFRHKLYEKVIRSLKKYYVHDENEISHTGDKVKIVQSRPMSKLKRWYIVEVIKK